MALIPINQLNSRDLARIQNAAGRINTGQAGRQLSGGNGSDLSRQVQNLANRLDQLSKRVDKQHRESASASISTGNRQMNQSGSIRNAQYGHGGVQYSDQESFAGATISAGTELDIAVSGVDLNRIQDAYLCDVEAIVGDELYSEAQNFSVTMTLNGDPVPAMRNIPLSWMIETVDGERQVWPVDQYLTSSDVPEFTVTARNGVTFTAQQDVEFRLSAGGDCG